MSKEKLNNLIDKVVGKDGPLRTPAYWMNNVLNKIVDLIYSNDKQVRRELASVIDYVINFAKDNEVAFVDSESSYPNYIALNPKKPTILFDLMPEGYSFRNIGRGESELYTFLDTTSSSSYKQKQIIKPMNPLGLYKISFFSNGDSKLHPSVNVTELNCNDDIVIATIPITSVGEKLQLPTGVIYYKGKVVSAEHMPDYIGDHTYVFINAGFYNSDVLQKSSEIRLLNALSSTAVRGNTTLTNVVIGKGITSIPSYTFENCSSLKSVSIGEDVASIKNAAFNGCVNLERIDITDLSAWCKISFDYYLSGTSNPLQYAHNLYLNGVLVDKLYFPSDVEEIRPGAFDGCNNLKYINIPGNINRIGQAAFSECSDLKTVFLEYGVSSISSYAFYNCSSLVTVTLPETINQLGQRVFEGCTGELIINGRIGGYDLPQRSAFYQAKFNRITIGDRVTAIGNHAFYECQKLTSVTIPNSVTMIGEYAFYGCNLLRSITVPDSVTTIGAAAFAKCNYLKEFNSKLATEDGRCLIIDGVLKSFAPHGLTQYTIPDSVTTIGGYAFAYCSNLTSVTIPNSVTTIGDRAFYYCDSLKNVYCKATTPPSLGGTSVFDNNNSARNIYVPTDSVNAYKSATNWSEYADAIIGYDFENNIPVE